MDKKTIKDKLTNIYSSSIGIIGVIIFAAIFIFFSYFCFKGMSVDEDKLIQKGYDEGYHDAQMEETDYSIGYREGKSDGYKEGYNDGYSDGSEYEHEEDDYEPDDDRDRDYLFTR